MKKKILISLSLLAVACLIPLLILRERRNQRTDLTFLSMDTVMSLSVYGPDSEELAEEARRLILSVEQELSASLSQSVLSGANREGRADFSPETARLLRFSLDFSRRTGGAFSPLMGPIMKAWGFTGEKNRVPPQEELKALIPLTEVSQASLEGTTLTLKKGAQLDLGAAGKGFAGDRAAGLLRSRGVASALLNLGGNVQTVGLRPDGRPWRVGVMAPEGGLLGVLETGEGAVITSGSYERFFTDADGTLYGHIIDPSTGTPPRSGIVSATAVGTSGTLCDALSTALFVMGPDRAADFWRKSGEDFGFILLTEEPAFYVTENILPRFRPDENFSDVPLRVVAGKAGRP